MTTTPADPPPRRPDRLDLMAAALVLGMAAVSLRSGLEAAGWWLALLGWGR